MSIKTVEYRRLVSHGEYENTAIGAVAEVEAGEDAAVTLSQLTEWVESQIQEKVKVGDELLQLHNQASSLRWTVQDYERQLAEAKTRWDAAVKILEAHGVEVPRAPRDDDGMPF